MYQLLIIYMAVPSKHASLKAECLLRIMHLIVQIF